MADNGSNSAGGNGMGGAAGMGGFGGAPGQNGQGGQFGQARKDQQVAFMRTQRREGMGKLFDRQPPHSVEAEMSLLGSMILDPRVVADVIQILRGPDAFYVETHGLIYQAVVSLVDSHGTVDPVMLLDKLRDAGVLETIGGAAYIEKLATEVPTAVNAPYFAKVVSEKSKLRRLIDAAGDILHETYHASSTEGDAAKLIIDSAEQRIFTIAQDEQTSDIESLNQLLTAEYSRLMEIEAGKPVESGVMTGFHDLDRDTTGLHGGEMIILAARPSMGKTAFVLNLAEQISMGTDQPASTHRVRNAVPVGVFSLEMSKGSLAQRLLSSWSGIESQRIRSGQLSSSKTNDEFALLLQATQALGGAPMYIDDTPGLTLMSLRARARRMVAQHKVKVIIVDYLQLLSSPQSAKESRQAEVGSISRGLKALARELRVAVIALSQLNRNVEGRDGNKPRLSDLRESGSIEQDADMVWLLHREEYYHIGDMAWLGDPANADKIGLAEIIIAKQRNGPTGSVSMTWDNRTTRFKNFTSSHQDAYVHTPPARQAVASQSGPGQYGGGGVQNCDDDALIAAIEHRVSVVCSNGPPTND